MTTAQICITAVIILYLCFVIFTGIMIGRRSKKSAEGFYLGGRGMGPLVTAMSAEASDMSSWLLMGLPGVAYLSGVADAGWTAIGLALGTYLNFLLVAKRIRRYSVRLDAITIPAFISKRYQEKKPVIMCIASLIILIFFVPYVASGLAAIGKLFNSLFGWNYMVSVLIGAAVIISYTSVGGFSAVATMDLIQSIIMTCALVVITCFGIYQAGGLDVVVENAKALPGYLSFTQTYDVASHAAKPYPFLNMASMLAWGLGYFGMPHILVRFMAIRDENELKLSRRIASVWVVISMTVAVCIGMIGYSVSKAGRIPLLEGSNSETVIVQISNLLSSYGVLPAIVAGLILAGILAATMSTADSQLLAAASAFSENLLQDVFGIKLTQKQTMVVARLTVICIAVVAVFLAADPTSSVFRIVSFAWAGFGATFGPAVLFALFWKRSNRQGILAGLVVGGVMVFVWKFVIAKLGGMFAIYELLPAFLCASIAIVVVSLATPAPGKEVLDLYDSCNQ
ncbi:sodium/proline symporter [Pseudoflavonifractor phocaeensis]|uniref:sodium/proline symporter n=1 Tax=Pseudoflavonifractor phocaeensis TaxID=1870988 RepID=UPI001F177A9A|nr:sodium/proline symporter [Pseudoflavonifractor phocaeensis]MCF2661881.1 sodium/proline symporter [Pseudoflavonifractor phocaeensis]